MKNNNYSKSFFLPVSAKTTVIGGCQIAVGVLVIILAIFTVWLNIWVLGILLVLWGAMDFLQFFNSSGFPWNYLLLSALQIGTGGILFFSRGMGVVTLSLILAGFFIFNGLYKILAALAERPPNWGLLVFGGGLSIILGFFVFTQWPVEEYLILGVLVGIETILKGWSLLAVGELLS